MRVKRSVDFRMAPKKTTKGKGVAAEPTRDEGWKDDPYENTGEIIAFTSYLERGLGFPCSSFFSGLMRYYRIQLHHLTPNSFVHISIFVHLCEDFLGIEPHFELFRFFLFETAAQQIRLRCSRGHGSPT